MQVARRLHGGFATVKISRPTNIRWSNLTLTRASHMQGPTTFLKDQQDDWVSEDYEIFFIQRLV